MKKQNRNQKPPPKPRAATPATAGRASAQRPVRADALRNIDALLQAAKAVFLTSGVDAPVREIADQAGVGIGTVYRHFPHRADLINAVFRHEVDACADAAPLLAQQHGPLEALRAWVERFAEFIRTKRGLAGALYSGDPAYRSVPDYLTQRLRPAIEGLLLAAAEGGAIRGGVDPDELLWAVASLCASPRDAEPATIRRMIGLLLDGLRYDIGTPSKPRRRR